MITPGTLNHLEKQFLQAVDPFFFIKQTPMNLTAQVFKILFENVSYPQGNELLAHVNNQRVACVAILKTINERWSCSDI
jgi:hypothetical protein